MKRMQLLKRPYFFISIIVLFLLIWGTNAGSFKAEQSGLYRIRASVNDIFGRAVVAQTEFTLRDFFILLISISCMPAGIFPEILINKI